MCLVIMEYSGTIGNHNGMRVLIQKCHATSLKDLLSKGDVFKTVPGEPHFKITSVSLNRFCMLVFVLLCMGSYMLACSILFILLHTAATWKSIGPTTWPVASFKPESNPLSGDSVSPVGLSTTQLKGMTKPCHPTHHAPRAA